LDYDCPISERKIYDALEKALPKNWYGWHSLKVRTERFGIAETDFVIADPNQGEVINDLMKEGFERKDIAVISLGGMLLPENIMYEEELGGPRHFIHNRKVN
jgi:hypothetical protein